MQRILIVVACVVAGLVLIGFFAKTFLSGSQTPPNAARMGFAAPGVAEVGFAAPNGLGNSQGVGNMNTYLKYIVDLWGTIKLNQGAIEEYRKYIGAVFQNARQKVPATILNLFASYDQVMSKMTQFHGNDTTRPYSVMLDYLSAHKALIQGVWNDPQFQTLINQNDKIAHFVNNNANAIQTGYSLMNSEMIVFKQYLVGSDSGYAFTDSMGHLLHATRVVDDSFQYLMYLVNNNPNALSRSLTDAYIQWHNAYLALPQGFGSADIFHYATPLQAAIPAYIQALKTDPKVAQLANSDPNIGAALAFTFDNLSAFLPFFSAQLQTYQSAIQS